MLKHFITKELKRPFTDLVMVVVTHMHPDHAGAAAFLRKLTGCRIASAKKSRHWYAGVKGILMQLTDITLAHYVASRLGRPKQRLWYNPYLKLDIELQDGDCLPGFEDWQVVATPGHTDRDLSLLHNPSGRIYIADLAVKVKGRFIAPFPVSFPHDYHASIVHLRSMQPASIMLAHGGEVQFSAADYQHLFDSAPHSPQTPWRVIKAKLKRVFLHR